MPRARKRTGIEDLTSTQHGEVADLMRQQQATPPAFIGPDEVPNLSDPTAHPEEPLTAGLDIGAGAGSEVMQPMSPDPVRKTLEAMLLFNPENHDVMRLIDMLDEMGR